MGTLVLAGSDTYSGGTTINAGILQAGNANALGPATNSLTVASGTLDTHGFSIGVGSLSGSGHIDNLSGTGVYTLTVGSGDSDSNFSGSIGTTGTSQSTTGLIALAKVATAPWYSAATTCTPAARRSPTARSSLTDRPRCPTRAF